MGLEPANIALTMGLLVPNSRSPYRNKRDCAIVIFNVADRKYSSPLKAIAADVRSRLIVVICG